MREDQRAHRGVVLAEDAHDLLGLGGLGEGGEAAQVEEDDGDLAAVASASGSSAPPVHDQLGELRREEALQPRRGARAGRPAPRRAARASGSSSASSAACASTVSWSALMRSIDSHARDQRGVVDGLRQVLVAAGLEAGHDVLRIRLRGDHDDRREREARDRLAARRQTSMPSTLGIMTSSRIRSGRGSRAAASASSPSAAVRIS